MQNDDVWLDEILNSNVDSKIMALFMELENSDGYQKADVAALELSSRIRVAKTVLVTSLLSSEPFF